MNDTGFIYFLKFIVKEASFSYSYLFRFNSSIFLVFDYKLVPKSSNEGSSIFNSSLFYKSFSSISLKAKLDLPSASILCFINMTI